MEHQKDILNTLEKTQSNEKPASSSLPDKPAVFWGFFRRHLKVHIWAAAVAALFIIYAVSIQSTKAANSVSGFTQFFKESWSELWYIFPFSVVEWFYAAFIVGAIAWLVVLCYRLITRSERLHTAYGGLLGFACLFLTAWGLYCVLWGVNYYADGFQTKSGIYAKPASVADLERVTAYFVQELTVLSDEVPRDENGVFSVPREEIFARSTSVYDNISEEFPFLTQEDKVPKPMFFSRLFSAMNFTGFYSPYTGESNLNTDSPVCLLPASIAHELAHQRGIASEQECNFIAVAAATASDDPLYQYSGYLMGYIHLSNALYSADRDSWEKISALLPDGVTRDLLDHSVYWAQFKGVTATASQAVYDGILKSYGQDDGIKSYGTVVDLLIAYY